MKSRFGLSVILVAFSVLVGCGKQQAAVVASSADASPAAAKPPSIDKYLGNYEFDEKIEFGDYSAPLVTNFILTPTQLYMKKDCKVFYQSDRAPWKTESVEGSVELTIKDADHIEVSEALNKQQVVTIGSSGNLNCYVFAPKGNYALSMVGGEIYIAGPGGLVLRGSRK